MCIPPFIPLSSFLLFSLFLFYSCSICTQLRMRSIGVPSFRFRRSQPHHCHYHHHHIAFEESNHITREKTCVAGSPQHFIFSLFLAFTLISIVSPISFHWNIIA